MSALTRQNTLFVSEDWIRIYEAIQNVETEAGDKPVKDVSIVTLKIERI